MAPVDGAGGALCVANLDHEGDAGNPGRYIAEGESCGERVGNSVAGVCEESGGGETGKARATPGQALARMRGGVGAFASGDEEDSAGDRV